MEKLPSIPQTSSDDEEEISEIMLKEDGKTRRDGVVADEKPQWSDAYRLIFSKLADPKQLREELQAPNFGDGDVFPTSEGSYHGGNMYS